MIFLLQIIYFLCKELDNYRFIMELEIFQIYL
jgi:hypothetical protein